MKKFFIGAGIFVGVIALAFILELAGLGFFKFFEPKRENIRREIFENTKSFTHGKIKDLSKYYKEYKETDPDGQAVIEVIIRTEFADFDKTKINTVTLQNFLTEIRGY